MELGQPKEYFRATLAGFFTGAIWGFWAPVGGVVLATWEWIATRKQETRHGELGPQLVLVAVSLTGWWRITGVLSPYSYLPYLIVLAVLPFAYLWFSRATNAGFPWGVGLVFLGIVAPFLGHMAEYSVLFDGWYLKLPFVPVLLLLLASFGPAIIGLELGVFARRPAHRRAALAMLVLGVTITCLLGFIVLLPKK